MAKRNVDNLVEEMFSGKEPSMSLEEIKAIQSIPENEKMKSETYKFPLSKMLNWYSYRSIEKSCRQWVKQYAVNKHLFSDKKKLEYIQGFEIKDIIHNPVIGNLGVWCRIGLNGFPFCVEHEDKIRTAIEALIDKSDRKLATSSIKDENSQLIALNNQTKLEDAEREVLGEVEIFIDEVLFTDPKKFDAINTRFRMFVDSFVSNESQLNKSKTVIKMIDIVDRHIVEVEKDFDDEVAKYQSGSKPKFKKLRDQLDSWTTYLKSKQSEASSVTKTGKIRKKRKQSPEKIVSKLQYMKEYDGIKSIDPRKAIGCRRLVLFDTKRFKLHLLVAKAGTEGLSFKKSKVINFDTSQSYRRSCKTSWKTVVERIQGPGGVKSLEAALDKLMTESYPTPGRITRDMIIVSWFQA